jgi:hypothetical protein
MRLICHFANCFLRYAIPLCTGYNRPVNASVQSGTLRHEQQQTAINSSTTATGTSTDALTTAAISGDSITSFLRLA